MISMIRSRTLQAVLFCAATASLMTACEKRSDGEMHFVGQPDPDKKWKAPSEITDFDTLYSQNCVACHGSGKTLGAAISMDNQTYLNLVPADVFRNVVIHGVKGTRMPGFGESEGGDLTDAQIDIVVNGILAWKKPLDPANGPLPAYAAAPGNAANGEQLFAQSFEKGRPANETYLNAAFLGLVSDQYLRTLVIVGQPELGYPGYRDFVPGRPLSDQEISDVVAYLISNRKNEFGEPLAAAPSPTPASGLPAEAPAPNSSADQQVP